MKTKQLTRHWLLALTILPALGLVLIAGCNGNRSPESIPLPNTPVKVVTREFVGSESCRECHAKEFAAHQATNHAHTLSPMTTAAIGNRAFPNGRLPGSNFAVGAMGEDFMVGKPATGDMGRLDFALGSGKAGMTYVAFRPNNQLMELRDSYFPRFKKWAGTPGQEDRHNDPNFVGRVHPEKVARRCLSCHAVTLPLSSLEPEPKFYGVGCESCHGAGSLHLETARALGVKTVTATEKRSASPAPPNGDWQIESLRAMGGKEMNALCGKCHRTPDDAMAVAASFRSTHRFMPYGLAQSQCFQQSQNQLTCVSCHAPHQNASTERKGYEAVCLSCHAGPHSGSAPLAAGQVTQFRIPIVGKVCPVNPRTACTDCHMPKRRVFAANIAPVYMADHWIKVYKTQK